MDKNFYVVTADFRKLTNEEVEKFHIFVKNNRHVEAWHSPFLGMILIMSFAAARELADSLREFVGNMSLYVGQVHLGNNFGYLPPESWAWIDKEAFGSVDPSEIESS